MIKQTNTQVKEYIAAIISGLLLVISFPPNTFPTFAFFAFVPLLFKLRENVKHPFRLVYTTFFIYHLGSNWWISSWQELTDPYLFATGFVLDFFHPLFFLIPFIPFFYIKRKLGYKTAINFFPFLWVAFEYLHSIGDLGYSWLTIGHSMINYRTWLQFIDITGIFGASFLIVICNIVLIKIFVLMVDEDKSFGKILKENNILTMAIIAIIAIPGLYGFVRLQDYRIDKYENNEKINVAIVQPNINPWNKWETSPMELIRKHFLLQDSLINITNENQLKNNSNEFKFDMALWGETAIPYLGINFNSEHNMPVLTDYVNMSKLPILSGYVDLRIFKEGDDIPIEATPLQFDSTRQYVTYNSAILLNPTDEIEVEPQIYHKMHLTVFAERVPYYEIFGFMKNLIKWGVGISSWGKGKEQKNLLLHKDGKKIPVASIICIESIFPDFVRRFTKQGAEFLTIITNDSWYDYTTGPEQHWNIARVRAIENRRFVVRSANSGVSGLISPTGEELARLPQYQAVALGVPVPLLKEKSFYVKYGDWLSFIILFISLFGILYARLKK